MATSGDFEMAIDTSTPIATPAIVRPTAECVLTGRT
jgi:hypothetical protein